jgi:hypothetical protein
MCVTESTLKHTEKELFTGYMIWRRRFCEFAVDDWLWSLRDFKPPKEGVSWLRVARMALQLSTRSVADRLGYAQHAYCRLEKDEPEGCISLEVMKAAAEAMDCELIYFIRPKKYKTFSERIWSSVLPETLKHPAISTCVAHRRGFRLADLAFQTARKPKFRRRQGWARWNFSQPTEDLGNPDYSVYHAIHGVPKRT